MIEIELSENTPQSALPSVLVVDDDPTLRTLVRRMLESAGFLVEEVSSGVAVVESVRTLLPDVVLCDLFMPGKGGIEVIRNLRCEFAGVRVVAMSGGGPDGRADTLQLARALGAISILYKPFREPELLGVLRCVLAMPSAWMMGRGGFTENRTDK